MLGESSTSEKDGESEEKLYEDLSEAVKAARRGFRRDVEALVKALPKGGLLVPLASSVEGLEEGQDPSEADSVTIRPHLLPDRDGTFFVPLFTDADSLITVGEYVEWVTDDGDELQYCTLPAPIAIELAQQLLRDDKVVGAVINPSDECELVLRPHELGALSQSQAIPLVGYVQDIPVGDEEEVLIAELEHPPSAELVEAIERCLSGLAGLSGYRIEQTFNRERDLEPHPTLTLCVTDVDALDTEKLNELLAAELEGKVPEPGYIDVLFDTESAKAD